MQRNAGSNSWFRRVVVPSFFLSFILLRENSIIRITMEVSDLHYQAAIGWYLIIGYNTTVLPTFILT
ncbi:hypothetical protein GGR58DRAFT_451667 [Xylaria digitata]|nr:hypothetical protein GGR58DRAFT_451667 [Xylaria digitata]